MTRAAWMLPMVDGRGRRLRCLMCGARAVHRHHVVYEQHVRREGGDPWDVRNSIPMCVACHARQHSGFARVPIERIHDGAKDFAIELFGAAKAALYFSRYYTTNQEG